MSDPFLGEMRIIGFNYPPQGWAFCNGQVLPINQNQALFALLGTTYGGNGQTTFALPNMQGRIPVHMGAGFTQGASGGEEAHTLTINEMPMHYHSAAASSGAATQQSPQGNVWAANRYTAYASSPQQTLAAAALTPVGGSQPHYNMPPYLVLNFIIAITGIFPSRS